MSRAVPGCLCAVLFGLPGCGSGGGADLSRVNAFGAPVVRGAVGGRLEAEFAPGQEFYSRSLGDGAAAAEILMVANDAKRQAIEVHLRLFNRTRSPLEVDPDGVRLLFQGLELPALEADRLSIPPGLSRLIFWTFELGEAVDSGIHELRIDLPSGEPLRVPVKVPGSF